MVAYTDEELLDKFKKNKQRSESKLDLQHDKARRAHGFFAGDSMYYQASVSDKSGVKRSVVFNKVKPIVDAISGFFIQIRRKPYYEARIVENESQQQYSSVANSASDYFRSNANMDQVESQQDKECLIAGYAAIDTNISYDLNPSGDIRSENIKFDEVWWDPQAREKNLLDAKWVYRKKDFYPEEAMALFEDADLSDFNYNPSDDTDWMPNPAGAPYTLVKYGTQADDDLVSVYYYQWFEYEDYYIAQNPLAELIANEDDFGATQLLEMLDTITQDRQDTIDGDIKYMVDDIFTFDPNKEELVMSDIVYKDVRETIKIFNELYGYDIQLEPVVHKRKCYYTAILSDSKVFKKFKSPDQTGFTIKFKTGDYDANNEIWFGIVSQLEEPVKYANKSLTEILYIIAATSKAGVFYESDAVKSGFQFEQDYARTNAVIKVEPGAISGNKIKEKGVPSMPTGYENIYAIANSSIADVSGVNKEFLGSSENKQVSALMEEQRIERVVSNLASYVDSIMLYQKEHARLMLTFIRMLASNSSGRLIRIVGEDGEKSLIELSEDIFISEYDIDIGEAPTTATQRERTYELLINTIQLIGESSASIIGPIAVDYLPLKASEKAKIKAALQPAEGQNKAAEIQELIARTAIETEKVNQMKTMKEIEYKDTQMKKEIASAQETMLKAEQIDIENDLLARQAVTPQISVTI